MYVCICMSINIYRAHSPSHTQAHTHTHIRTHQLWKRPPDHCLSLQSALSFSHTDTQTHTYTHTHTPAVEASS